LPIRDELRVDSEGPMSGWVAVTIVAGSRRYAFDASFTPNDSIAGLVCRSRRHFLRALVARPGLFVPRTFRIRRRDDGSFQFSWSVLAILSSRFKERCL
jgi:hypothetical protein